jgi:nitrogenase molybdenum-cofactor synthesis protein NifE
MKVLKERDKQILTKGKDAHKMVCEKPSLAGSVSQRACVFCGSRVVLYPIVDAVHLIHGPIGCAAYTWDIRGAISSGPELHRLSFSTDLREKDVVYGGEKKLDRALCELIDEYEPKAAFVYSTCIVGVIGDDIQAVCKRVAAEKGIPVLPVHSEGFKGTKKDGYRAACSALFQLVGTGSTEGISPRSINIVGDFNLAGETWMIRDYYQRMGVEVVATMTGDGRIDDIRRSHGAALNVVQCSGSMVYLAKEMEEKYGIPYIRVSYFGLEDMSKALYDVADFFEDEEIQKNAHDLGTERSPGNHAQPAPFRKDLERQAGSRLRGRSLQDFLARAIATDPRNEDVILAGSQTGNKEDYELLGEPCVTRAPCWWTIRIRWNYLQVRTRRVGRRSVHRRGQRAPHGLQAGDRLLRSQSRTENPPGGLSGDEEIRPGSPRDGL